MSISKWFASIILAAAAVSTVSAETHCPGDVASLTFNLANRHQIIVPVSINHAGPFNFLLDTGTQMTMVDPALAAELHLSTEGTANVASVGVSATASFARLDLIEAGASAAANQKVLVYDLHNLQTSGLPIRGVLGEDFLERYDMLIDNGHNLLCLDDTGKMRANIKGAHIALQASDQGAEGASLAASLIVTARLSDGMRPVRLKLDSGSNVPFLYNPSETLALGLFHNVSLQGGGSGGAQRTFTALPAQNVKIGSVDLTKVTFITLAGAQKNSHTTEFDGLLTMGLFRRVFVDHTDHYAVLDPW